MCNQCATDQGYLPPCAIAMLIAAAWNQAVAMPELLAQASARSHMSIKNSHVAAANKQ